MKKLMILLAMAMMCSIAMAQSETTRTIHGAVIDKNGNPLPGAVVSATDGAETAFVNADGTFELEIPMWLKSVTASYAGYKNKKMKPRFDQEMIFRLKKDKTKFGFINFFGGANFYEYGENIGGAIGLMGGSLNNWGGYAKVGLTINEDVYLGGLVIGGVTKRICKNVYGYLGVGYGSVFYDGYDYDGYDYEYINHGMAFDLGVIFKLSRHFDLTVGYTQTTDFIDIQECNFIPNVSFGYVF
ncbi:MAG: carboxypeptidase-like regulatory domain-containing protein [Muribaculaceae bacterium]|nr:carboxypeptidase-like regulatory domain-containing protein [Muribaculaceae bacterium]